MMSFIRYIDNIIVRLANQETNAIDQARIRMLVYILIFYMLFSGTLMIAYSIEGRVLHLLRVSFVFGCASFLLAVVRYTKRWKLISHFAVALVTLSVWSNILVY